LKKQQKNISIIDKELTIDGSVSFKGQLIIKGAVRGNLNGETVVIAEEGSVHADAKARNITVAGTFEGVLRVHEKLVVLSTGSCSGKIMYKDMEVETGGILNAEVTRTP
jgi:cytoskeletal protein CcmA (bactofilin family)